MDKPREQFPVGTIVKHFKRETVIGDKGTAFMYEVVAYAKSVDEEEGGRTLVIYRPLYGLDNTCYARDLDNFYSETPKDKYPNIKQKYRFEAVTDEELKSTHIECKFLKGE